MIAYLSSTFENSSSSGFKKMTSQSQNSAQPSYLLSIGTKKREKVNSLEKIDPSSQQA